ncbi:rod shape-determining protein MreD [Ureibacillus sp. FSL K6-8385]|uniref:rod shape-determining protein MreD n=1 Tax=Ureibacillus sp. FSL K6-8385 TaxID=2954684 RepID=UPI003158B1A8
MWIRFMIPAVAIILFLLEPEFALFSPIEWNGELFYFVPRFLILYLIFLSIYYNPKRAATYGLIFGLLYDVFYIDIIGLYTVLYPLMCFLANWTNKYIHQHLTFTTILSVLLVALMELVLYIFFHHIIHFTNLAFTEFFVKRLIPSIFANLIYLMMLGWAFKYLIDARVLQKLRELS